jgi:predicted alpha/beta hydrolase
MLLQQNPELSETEIQFPALDGHGLSGILYHVPQSTAPRRAVLLNCGVGISARRYRRFARYLAASGIPVLTYDYRGIGASRSGTLRGFRATAYDWSESDCAGAIAFLRAAYPTAQLFGVAHSVGGLLFGGAPNVAELAGFVLVSVHTGYYGDYRWRNRIPMALVWHAGMPFLTRIVGYFPASLFGWGEDLPAGVANQWAGRKDPNLTPKLGSPDATARAQLLRRCASIVRPALVLSFSDDAFATRIATARLLSYFPGLVTERVEITPKRAGMKSIGHFGFFRREAEALLWPIVRTYLTTDTEARVNAPEK